MLLIVLFSTQMWGQYSIYSRLECLKGHPKTIVAGKLSFEYDYDGRLTMSKADSNIMYYRWEKDNKTVKCYSGILATMSQSDYPMCIYIYIQENTPESLVFYSGTSRTSASFDSFGRLVRITKETITQGGYVTKEYSEYIYDGTSHNPSMIIAPITDNVAKFDYLDFDGYGNALHYTISFLNGVQEEITRTITYYED